MNDIKVIARPLSRNHDITFSNIKSLRVVSSLDSPAESMSAVVAFDNFPGEIGDVSAYDGTKLLFRGQIDCQQNSISGNGVSLRLDARSGGALLLDNQALPSVFLNAQIQVLFNRCVAPYGFSLYNPNRAVYIPMFTVHSGLSEWDAFVNFSRRAYGITPYIKGPQVMVKRPSGGVPIVISNSADGLNYTSLTHTRTPYNIISRFVIRDENGNYTLAVRNSEASYTNTTRKRYIVPASEYADRPGVDANQRIRRSMLEYEHVTATLPGIFIVAFGEDVIIRDDRIRLSNLIVQKREYVVDENGIFTIIKAVNSMYYD